MFVHDFCYANPGTAAKILDDVVAYYTKYDPTQKPTEMPASRESKYNFDPLSPLIDTDLNFLLRQNLNLLNASKSNRNDDRRQTKINEEDGK